MVPSSSGLSQECRQCAGARLPAKLGGCGEPGRCQDVSLWNGMVPALASWHQQEAARALCCLS